jgi:hypothetical protein
MRLEITRLEGLRNDLALVIERGEIETALLNVAHRDRLLTLPGMPRHREATPAEQRGIADAKILIADHLRAMGVVSADGRPARRALAISNRNLGTNHGHVAWQRSETPSIFRLAEDPADSPSHSCLVVWRDGRISIDDLRFDVAAQRISLAVNGHDVSHDVEWATYGQRVLRSGTIARAETLLDQFYDARHVLAFDHHRAEGEAVRRALYDGYPGTFRANVRRAWEAGVPRARYFHNAVGVNQNQVVIVQREGTIEEIGAALAAAGAEDGVILDNGGSVVCWAWWANDYAGGVISPTVDYRPPGTSAIAFVLRGPVRTDMPGGSISPTTL